jgi:hypothetical protein
MNVDLKRTGQSSSRQRQPLDGACGSYGGSTTPSSQLTCGCVPRATCWNHCPSAPARCSTSPIGVQPDGSTGDRLVRTACTATGSTPVTTRRMVASLGGASSCATARCATSLGTSPSCSTRWTTLRHGTGTRRPRILCPGVPTTAPHEPSRIARDRCAERLNAVARLNLRGTGQGIHRPLQFEPFDPGRDQLFSGTASIVNDVRMQRPAGAEASCSLASNERFPCED